jgi:hypothetical protein
MATNLLNTGVNYRKVVYIEYISDNGYCPI